jgi:ribonucleoside-diphosphate reductase alpha chain
LRGATDGATALETTFSQDIAVGLDHLPWAAPAESQTVAEKIAEAKLKGYSGDPCPECGNFTMVRSGFCLRCECGATTGCS